MSILFKRRMNQKGWTIIELMMVVSIIGLIVPALTTLFFVVLSGSGLKPKCILP